MTVLDTDPNLDNYDLDGNHNAMYAYNGIPFTGIIRSFHSPTTQVEYESSYVNGLRWGLQRAWWPNGQLMSEYIRGIGGVMDYGEYGMNKAILFPQRCGLKVYYNLNEYVQLIAFHL